MKHQILRLTLTSKDNKSSKGADTTKNTSSLIVQRILIHERHKRDLQATLVEQVQKQRIRKQDQGVSLRQSSKS